MSDKDFEKVKEVFLKMGRASLKELKGLFTGNSKIIGYINKKMQEGNDVLERGKKELGLF